MTAFALPTALQSRPMRPDDAQRWADLLAAVEAVDSVGENVDVDDCVEELAEPETDYANNSILVLDGARAAGYLKLVTRAGNGFNGLYTDGRVHPDFRGRGIGTAFVAFARQRAAALGRDLYVPVPESVADAVALAEHSGMRPARYWSDLTRDLTQPLAPAVLPDGLSLHGLGREFDRARWDELLREACNAAFLDHWGSTPASLERWQHSETGGRSFRPFCSVAACLPDGAVVGLVLSHEHDADTAASGHRDLYVGTVATVREWRGRGLAGGMLAHVLGRAQGEGYATSSLTVDAANPTGALGVYERAGYVLERRTITYADSL